jgi:hypothetical protein
MNNGHRTSGDGQPSRGPLESTRTRAFLPVTARPEPGARGSTGEALAAVARDAIDVVSEMARDAIAIGRLEAQRAVADATPRVVWGVIAGVCGLCATVLALIAIFLVLGAVVPSVAGRLAIFAGLLFVVTFFGLIRASRSARPEAVESVRTKESPITESRHEEALHSSPPGQPGVPHMGPRVGE